MASAPPGGPSQGYRGSTRPPYTQQHCTLAGPDRLLAQGAPRDNLRAKRKQPKKRPQQSEESAGNGRYLCHSRCAWSSPLTPLGKQPPQAQQLPDGWGPLWPPSFLLPDNTRDTKWWQQIRQHPSRQAPRGSIWLGPRLPCQAAWLPARIGHRRKGRNIYSYTTDYPGVAFHLLTFPGDKVLVARQQGPEKEPFNSPIR